MKATEADLDRAIAQLPTNGHKAQKASPFIVRAGRTIERDGDGKPTTDQLLADALARVKPGEQKYGRNDTGLWLACQLRDNGHSKATAEKVMVDYAGKVPNHSHPYTEAEALKSCRQAYGRPAREPWEQARQDDEQQTAKDGAGASTVPPGTVDWEPPIELASEVPPAVGFPMSVFPPKLREYASEATEAIGCHPDFIAVTMLATAAGALGASRSVRIKHDFFQSGLLYTAMVGDPGTAKSPVLKLVGRVLHEAEQRFATTFKAKMKQYETDLAEYEAWKKNQSRKTSGGVPAVREKPERPIQKRIVVDNCTVEAVGRTLNENHRGIFMLKDELTGWVNAENQYKGGRGNDRQFWLSNWAGVPISVDRVKQETPLYIAHPHVSILGGIQPDMLATMRDHHDRADGFCDRILFCFPDSNPTPAWTWDEIPEDKAEAWRSTVTKLLGLEMEGGGTDEDGNETQAVPRVVFLERNARPDWERLMNCLADQMNNPELAPILKGPLAKLRVYAARFALVLHLLWAANGVGDEEKLSPESIRRAAALVDYFLSHAKKVYAHMIQDGAVQDCRRVLDWIAREGLTEFKRKDAYSALKNKRFAKLEDFDPLLKRLIDHGYLRARPGEKRQGAGRPPAEIFEVNPLWERSASVRTEII